MRGRVEVPVRHAVGRHAARPVVRRALRRLEQARVARSLVGLREAVDRPRLAARPRRIRRQPGAVRLALHRARRRVEDHDVERAAVGAQVVRARRQRVLRRDPGVRGIAAVRRRPAQQLEVHQPVDDQIEVARLGADRVVPRADRADDRAPARRQRHRRVEHHLVRSRRARQPDVVAEARADHQPDVLRAAVGGLAGDPGLARPRHLQPLRVARRLVHQPLRAGQVAARPVRGVRRHPGAGGRRVVRVDGRGERSVGRRQALSGERERVLDARVERRVGARRGRRAERERERRQRNRRQPCRAASAWADRGHAATLPAPAGRNG